MIIIVIGATGVANSSSLTELSFEIFLYEDVADFESKSTPSGDSSGVKAALPTFLIQPPSSVWRSRGVVGEVTLSRLISCRSSFEMSKGKKRKKSEIAWLISVYAAERLVYHHWMEENSEN